MGRGKLALELIGKEKARKITYEKRKKGLIKKAREFSILCGVDTCMIIYGTPTISDRPENPEIWPSDPREVECIIQRYKNEGADCRTKRSVGLADFFLNRKKRLDVELAKAHSAVWEAKYPVSDDLISGLSEEQLRSLLADLGGRLELAKKHLVALKEKELAAAAVVAPRNYISNSLDILPMPGVDFGHSFFLHSPSAMAGLFSEPKPVLDINLPHEPNYMPNIHGSPLTNLPALDLPHLTSATGFVQQHTASSSGLMGGGGGSGMVDQERIQPPLNSFHHDHPPIINQPVQNGCFNRTHDGECCLEFGSVNMACFCELPCSGGIYGEVPVTKQFTPSGRGQVNQFHQFEMMDMKSDPSSGLLTYQMQTGAELPESNA
ncbi:hypothetical protein SAY86_024646 [Trapa natans]|uniref:MADS-box domain-containing protein n=1 Tax=Trapa natans TaxID=22666 RepID=A0AAN7MQ94_TRANT|nr:hypothetical protein SAY86_024646 [Trapa natans]